MVGGGTRRGGVVATVTGTGTGAGVAWCGDVAVLKGMCRDKIQGLETRMRLEP